MCQQMFDRDPLTLRTFQCRNIFRDGVTQTNLATFHEHHDAGGSGNHFRQTGDIENGVSRHRLVSRLGCAGAICFAPRDAYVRTNQYDSAWKMTLDNLFVDYSIDPG